MRVLESEGYRRSLARAVFRAGPVRAAPVLEKLRRSQWETPEVLAARQRDLLHRLGDAWPNGDGLHLGRRVSTSGTTGRPKRVLWSREAMRWQDAAEERSREWAGVGGGRSRLWICCNPADPLRLLGLAAANTRLVPAPAVSGSNGAASSLAERIADRPPAIIQGVSNALAVLARELSERGVHLQQTTCLSAGNHLTPWYRRAMERAFAGPIRERYATVETGLIAASCERGTLHVNAESLLVELLDPRGCPVPPGERGSVAVTTLRNRTAPLVRYQPGDQARMPATLCGCGRGLPSIELSGRDLELLPGRDGAPVEPRRLFAALDAPDVVDLAVRATRFGSLAVDVQLVADTDRSAACSRIEMALREVLAIDGGVTVRPLERVAPCSSGKTSLIAVAR